MNRKGRFSYSFRAGAGLSGKAVFGSAGKVLVSRRARDYMAQACPVSHWRGHILALCRREVVECG